MALQIFSITPSNNANGIAIDSKIEIGFSSPVDPFTIPVGISLYSIGSSTMTGPLMSELDVATSDVNDPFENISIVAFSYTTSGSDVSITPLVPFKGDTKYYLQIVPGEDPTRFISTKTFSDIIYSKASSASNGEVNITSAYIGKTDCTYIMSITASGSFDLSKNGVYIDSYDYVEGEELLIDKVIKLSINGTFQIDDTAEFSVYKSIGVTSSYKSSFTTSNYVTATVKSTRIEDKLYKQLISDLKIVSVTPATLTINNERCNPILVRFNRPIDKFQDVASKINIHKSDIETGMTKKVNYYSQINGDTLKIYLVSVEPSSDFSDAPMYTSNTQDLSLPTFKNSNSLF